MLVVTASGLSLPLDLLPQGKPELGSPYRLPALTVITTYSYYYYNYYYY